MKLGKNLTELAQEIERRANDKRDLMASVTKIEMQGDGKLAVGAESFQVNGYAHGQLAEYTGIPKAYYDRLPPVQRAYNVNHWLGVKQDSEAKERRLVRTLDGQVRAFLSDRYRPLDNEDLGEAILPVLMDMDLLFVNGEITDRRIYIKAVHKNILRDVPTGKRLGDGSHVFFDTVAPAVIVSNSEVGAGRLSIETGVYTKACTNLAMIGSGFKKQHVGGRAELLGEDVQHMLTDNTKRLNDAAVWATVTDVLKGAFDETKFKLLTDKLAGATEDRIDGDVVEVVNRFAKRHALGEETGKSILRHLIEGADLTRYGLHSAVTRASQDVEDYDVATDMERLGGQVIELNRNEWQELAKAA